MGNKQTTDLRSVYNNYYKKNKNKGNVLRFLSVFMPEIVFRTTKLEGEKVTRRRVSSAF